MEANTAAPPPLMKPVRGCDGCTLCCKVMAIGELSKPDGVWCQHCAIGSGCRIYETRPEVCAEFSCGYLMMPALTPEWKPSISHLVISGAVSENRVDIHVDPSRPDAWRREPYYRAIKAWSKNAITDRRQIVVMIGQRSIVPLPDHDADLGVIAANEDIVISTIPGASGMVHKAYAVRRDSEYGAQVEAAKGGPVRLPPIGGSGIREGRRLP